MMSHAETCPVCQGAGSKVPFEQPGFTTTTGHLPVTCHGCHGCGWVTVQDGQRESLEKMIARVPVVYVERGNWTGDARYPYGENR